jgi:hypothetical protein
MLFNETIFIGIDPTAGQRPMAYAALDRDLRLLALDEGDIDEITAFVGGQKSAFVAVASPRKPNQGLMKDDDVRQTLKPTPRPGRWLGYRVAEYQLRQHNIQVIRTCSAEDKCPNWIRMGFDLYRRLISMGCRDYPAAAEDTSQVLEVYPHSIYTVLLGQTPFLKNSLEGRLQRQLILHNQGLDIPDPMRFFEEITRYRLLRGMLPLEGLYTPLKLDALAAAYTAWATAISPEKITILGRPEEGLIILPVPELKPKY